MVPQRVWQQLLVPNHVAGVDPVTAGMSGAKVFRCRGTQPLALRRWPTKTSARRVVEIQQVVGAAAGSCELLPTWKRSNVGDVGFVRDPQGHLWDLSSWLPGEPIAYDAPIRPIRIAAAAIARVHLALRDQGSWYQPARSISDRLVRIDMLTEQLPRALVAGSESSVHPLVSQELSAATKLLARDWPSVSGHLRRSLAPAREINLPVQYVLRDVHREHVLFEGDQVSGIIDFDALRVDSPLADLSRWASSFELFGRDPAAVIDQVVAGYRLDRSFFGGQTEPQIRTLIVSIANATTWISLANWVVWITLQSRQFPDWQRVGRRIRRLVDLAQKMQNRT